mgnify:CR=1 FL=1
MGANGNKSCAKTSGECLDGGIPRFSRIRSIEYSVPDRDLPRAKALWGRDRDAEYWFLASTPHSNGCRKRGRGVFSGGCTTAMTSGSGWKRATAGRLSHVGQAFHARMASPTALLAAIVCVWQDGFSSGHEREREREGDRDRAVPVVGVPFLPAPAVLS